MNIIIDKNAGFCYGVKNAVEMAFQLSDKNDKKIYTYGPLIHNESVIKALEAKNVYAINTLDCNYKDDTVIIRAHGISKAEYEALSSAFTQVIDCTCPNVIHIHDIVNQAFKEDFQVFIIGDSNHPEVKGIDGWCDNKAIILENEKTVDKLANYDKICIVAQTTITFDLWSRVISALKNKYTNMQIHNTICSATKNRQESSVELSRQVDSILVVGSKQSSNTNKLYELCKGENINTYFIESENDITEDMIRNKSKMGITAGASTPDWIIKEVISKMDEQQLSHDTDIYAQYENTFRELEMGQIITGKVIQITDDEIIVDIQYKTDGIIKKDDFSWDKNIDLKAAVQLEQVIEAEVYRIKESEGVYLSVKSIAARKNWTKLKDAFDANQTVEGVITSIVKGGGIVDVIGIRTFMPSSHFDLRYAEDLTPYLNQKVTVNIIDFVPEKKKIVVSRKEQLKKIQSEREKEVWEKVKVGEKITGEVKRLTNFGAFVDLGGIDGLIYITELSWSRVKHPADILKPGQQVEVIVLAADQETKKISLSLKQLEVNPWDLVSSKYTKDDIVEVKVLRFADFGAFVQLEPGIDGLVHISQISNKRVNKVSDELTVGQVVKAKILEVIPESKKISLSIKAANVVSEEAPETPEVPSENVSVEATEQTAE